MLVLTRHKEQEVVIGNEIVVRVVEVRPDGRVKLGFSAPQNIVIDRREVYERKRAEQRGEQ